MAAPSVVAEERISRVLETTTDSNFCKIKAILTFKWQQIVREKCNKALYSLDPPITKSVHYFTVWFSENICCFRTFPRYEEVLLYRGTSGMVLDIVKNFFLTSDILPLGTISNVMSHLLHQNHLVSSFLSKEELLTKSTGE